MLTNQINHLGTARPETNQSFLWMESPPGPYLPPKSCIPRRAKTTMKRKRRKSKLIMDFMELIKETTRFRRDAQYLWNPDEGTAVDRVSSYPQGQLAICLQVWDQQSLCLCEDNVIAVWSSTGKCVTQYFVIDSLLVWSLEECERWSRKGEARKRRNKISIPKGGGKSPDVNTYLVILNILRSRRARKTLIPKDVPGLKIAQTTSKMLPTVT